MQHSRMTALVVVLALAAGACSDATDGEDPSDSSTVTSQAEGTTTSATHGSTPSTDATPTTTRPPDSATTTATSTTLTSTTSTTTTVPIMRCADVAAAGRTYAEAVDFWLDQGAPARMDADGNGVPCETVYTAGEVAAVLADLTPTTTGEPFPEALSRDLVPWSQLGSGWYLATFLGSVLWGETEADLVFRPTVLYLIHQDGRIYELDNWSGETVHRRLTDWSPDGRYALAVTHSGAWDDLTVRAELLDLKTQRTTVLAEGSDAENRRYTFTRPTGRNIVEWYDGWETGMSWIRRLRRDGSLITTVATQEGDVGFRELGYLYLPDGSGLVIAEIGGLTLVRNSGTKIRDLWSPPGMWCTPTAWYRESSFSAACFSDDPEILPHEFFSESWLIPIDGTAGTAVTDELTRQTVEEDQHHGGHYGYSGAWPTAAGTIVQGNGDCSTAWIVTLDDDRSQTGSVPGNMLVGIHDGVAVVKTWEACDGTPGSLIASTVGGDVLRELITAEDPVGGISDVLGLAEPHR